MGGLCRGEAGFLHRVHSLQTLGRALTGRTATLISALTEGRGPLSAAISLFSTAAGPPAAAHAPHRPPNGPRSAATGPRDPPTGAPSPARGPRSAPAGTYTARGAALGPWPRPLPGALARPFARRFLRTRAGLSGHP